MTDTTTDAAKAEFLAKLKAFEGQEIDALVAPDPVNQPMIRHWAAALEDHNPVYTDPAFAAASRFGGIVAPPLMLQTWTMPAPTYRCARPSSASPAGASAGPGLHRR